MDLGNSLTSFGFRFVICRLGMIITTQSARLNVSYHLFCTAQSRTEKQKDKNVNFFFCSDPTSNLVFHFLLGKNRLPISKEKRYKNKWNQPKALSETSKDYYQTPTWWVHSNESETHGLDFPLKGPRGKQEGEDLRGQLAVPAPLCQPSQGSGRPESPSDIPFPTGP